MLGTSIDSAQLAAQSGLPYNLGLFISPQAEPSLINHYKRHFVAGIDCEKPYAIIAMSVFCADTEEQAKAQQLTFDINFYRYITGQRSTSGDAGLISTQQAQLYPLNSQLIEFIEKRSNNRAVGTPAQVQQTVAAVAKRYDADEIMAVSNIYHFEDRKRSFQLLKEVFSE